MRLKFTNILPLLLSLLACSSCVYDKFGVCPGEDIVMPGEEQYVNLDLRIAINDGEAPGSRAFNPDKDGTFEDPSSKYELVHTLRVVIVREITDKDDKDIITDRIIEHNRMVTVSDNYADNLIQSGDIINDNLRFNVVAGENKLIYLFANEAAVNLNKSETERFDFTTDLAVGTKFDVEKVANILIKRNPKAAFIDNTISATYVPMSECFDVEIPEFDKIPDSDGKINNTVAEKFLKKTLFITRSLIKFSFSVKLNTPGITSSQLKLTGVKISNLANEGYYLPNSTVYNPPKGTDANIKEERTITSFKVPYEGLQSPDLSKIYSECIFPFNVENGVSSNDTYASPYIYLPESKLIAGDQTYEVSLLFKNEELNEFYESQPLMLTDALKLTDIPRNTHMKINMTLTTAGLEATVAIVPYISVVLAPIFGFEEINPGIKDPEDE